MKKIKVLKKNLAGEIMWQYEGEVLRRAEKAVVLQALFDRDDFPLVDIVLRRKDRFVETYYSDKWFNIFEIYDRDDDHFKGYYCNVAMPALIGDDVVSFVDLALDLWVSANGKQTVLDEDEFEELHLDDNLREKAQAGLEELKARFKLNEPPE